MKTIYIYLLPFLLLFSCHTAIQHKNTGQALEYRLGDKPLLTCNYKTVYPSAEVDSVYKRSGFFHPINTISGETLTNLSPSDHYHHYGLWYAWTKTTFEGEEIDFWNVIKKQGTVSFREFTNISDSGFSAVLDHIVYPDSIARKTAIIENLQINIEKTSSSSYYINYTTSLQCATSSPITLECYRYGGLVIRTREDWTPSRTEFVTSEGFTRKNADDSEARWAFFQGKTDKKDACILILSHPSNLNHPEPLRIWDENANSGIGDMMWNFSPTKKQSYTLIPSAILKLHYRIFIFDKKIKTSEAEELWKKFAKEH